MIVTQDAIEAFASSLEKATEHHRDYVGHFSGDFEGCRHHKTVIAILTAIADAARVLGRSAHRVSDEHRNGEDRASGLSRAAMPARPDAGGGRPS